jgi:hypothetical protein
MYCIRYSCQILMSLEFSRQIFENNQIPNIMKLLAEGANLFQADGRTEDRRTNTTKLIVVFRNFAKALKKYQ